MRSAAAASPVKEGGRLWPGCGSYDVIVPGANQRVNRVVTWYDFVFLGPAERVQSPLNDVADRTVRDAVNEVQVANIIIGTFFSGLPS